MRGLKIELLPEIPCPSCLFFAKNPKFFICKNGKVLVNCTIGALIWVALICRRRGEERQKGDLKQSGNEHGDVGPMLSPLPQPSQNSLAILADRIKPAGGKDAHSFTALHPIPSREVMNKRTRERLAADVLTLRYMGSNIKQNPFQNGKRK